MIRCPSCSAQIQDGAHFCSSCGHAISSVSRMPTNIATPSVAEAARRRSPSSAPVGRLASSDSIEAGGFTPGAILLDRYRIIGLLGRGGMGEVYRADDLKLGQPVALKFLPRSLAGDPSRLERFYAEVRIARQVSHPNVCRVYDVGEMDGQQFLSMEFVDGEDLASLLRRIGRLPEDKALEIAREICAGLAAAHDKSVLHRDLKPANIMIDGRGRARITDFGLAVAGGDSTEGEISGTPAYMAPEQLAGRSASVQTDIYSLGLVLYELSTGRKAFDGASLPELKRKHAEEAPPSPSGISPGFDPVTERVILRCLEKDPSKRPASVSQVAAALPGGDPLAAAVAAGETPSPEMVAAAGEEGALSAARAWALLCGVLATALVVLLLSPKSTDLALAPLPKSPDTLVDRARDLAQRLGYADPPADSAYWWERNSDQLSFRAARLPSPKRVRELAAAEPHPWWLWYRQSPRPMVPLNGGERILRDDPPLEVSGMLRLALDARGNLVRLRAVAPQLDESKGPWPDPDWEALFREAGLDSKRFAASGPRWLPPATFDRRAEWDGAFPRQPDVPIHVTAASFHGKPVFFEVLGPWDRPVRMKEERPAFGALASRLTLVGLAFSLLLLGSIVARRNIRLGRGDRRGAFRVSVYLLAALLLSGLVGAHHVADFSSEWDLFVGQLGRALVFAVFVWLLYMALEPFGRRRWPDLLISWTRLLSGRFRDPLVARDVLLGMLAGGAIAIVSYVGNALPFWINVRGMTPMFPLPRSLGSPGELVGRFLAVGGYTVAQGLAIMSLLILASVLLRKRWLAIAVTGAVLTFLALGGENLAVEIPVGLTMAALTIFLAIRVGLLALIVRFAAEGLLEAFPLTTDFSRWYSGRSLFILLIFAGLAIYAFHVSLGDKPVFGAASLGEA